MRFRCNFSPVDNTFEGRSQGVAYNAAFLSDNSAKVLFVVNRVTYEKRDILWINYRGQLRRKMPIELRSS